MNGEYSALHLSHSHRALSWDWVLLQPGLMKPKLLSSQTLTRDTLISLCDLCHIVSLLQWKWLTGKLISACKWRVLLHIDRTPLKSPAVITQSTMATHNYDPVLHANNEYMDTQTGIVNEYSITATVEELCLHKLPTVLLRKYGFPVGQLLWCIRLLFPKWMLKPRLALALEPWNKM